MNNTPFKYGPPTNLTDAEALAPMENRRGRRAMKDKGQEPSPYLKKAFAPYVRKFGEQIESIRIGDFRLTRMATGDIWLGEADGGEGGQFKESAIEGAIAKFYAENF